MNSISAPYCPSCRQVMDQSDDGSWRCSECSHDSIPSSTKRERRSMVVRVLVTPTMYLDIMKAASGKYLSSWGEEVFRNHLANQAKGSDS